MSEASHADNECADIVSTPEVPRFDRWTTPNVDTDADNFNLTRGAQGLSIRDLERIQKEAYDEAYAQGLREGREQGEQDARENAHHFCALLDQLAEPFKELDDSVEQQTVQLAMTVVRSLFRRELKTDPSCVIGVVREALAALPVAARDVRVYLHPQDAELVNRIVSETDGERAWHIVEDPLLTRGGCRVETQTSRIDARVESRLATIASALIMDERGNRGDDES